MRSSRFRLAAGQAALALAAALALLAGCPDKKPKYPNCAGDKDCKPGEHCVDKKCVQCRDDDDCEKGQRCEANACVAAEGWCESDADCPNFQVCKDHQCVACTSDADCPGGKCTDGACLRPGQCVKDEDCADDEDCVDGRCQRVGLGGPQPDTTCTLESVYFEFDSAALSAEARDVLAKDADCLKQESERSVYVIGHTDPRGTDEYNIALSDGRARAVADYLARLGIDPARFRIVPKGEADATGTDEESWKRDRRVDFEWQ
ncbi:MAG: OmpA family protein [Deltaproteobacteria bacterium]|nr:MAG: OmpA family protein [Deltaproteobacteria bacterium]